MQIWTGPITRVSFRFMAKYIDQMSRRAFLVASGASVGVSAMHLSVAEALALRKREGLRVA